MSLNATLHAAREFDATRLSGQTRQFLARNGGDKLATLSASGSAVIHGGLTTADVDAMLDSAKLDIRARIAIKYDLAQAGIMRTV